MVGKTNTVNDEEIERFVDLFDGDFHKAVTALYKHEHDAAQKLSGEAARRPPGEVLISVKNLHKEYKVGSQKVSALRGVDLSIREGEFVALTGASGSGKSTLLQLIGGLDKPTAGTVIVDGEDVTKMRDGRLAEFRGQKIGFVFQFFYLQPFLKLGTNIEVPGMFSATKRTARHATVAELAEAVGLTDRINHLPRELSGGQMQRAAIARALLNKPKVLLADEPTGNLDSQNTEAIMKLFEKIRDEYGMTIVMVTHDNSLARRTDREIRISDGRVAV